MHQPSLINLCKSLMCDIIPIDFTYFFCLQIYIHTHVYGRKERMFYKTWFHGEIKCN